MFYGSDGRGEGFAFDLRKLDEPLSKSPFIGLCLTDADTAELRVGKRHDRPIRTLPLHT